VVGRIGLSQDLLRAHGLPNATFRLAHDDGPAVLGASGLRRVARRLVPLQGVRRAIGNVVRRSWRTRAAIRQEGIPVRLDLEQAPHPENRVLLSETVDAFGMPRAKLRYRVHPEDEARHRRVRDVLVREMERSGAGRLVPSGSAPLEIAVHHHAGTTRMSDDPADGVVDSSGRVHQLENLFVTGASLFPTAGVANPTLTVVALALRLADHLARERRSPPPAGRTPSQF
jgi:choline dehydrogenase-like flavoprotein